MAALPMLLPSGQPERRQMPWLQFIILVGNRVLSASPSSSCQDSERVVSEARSCRSLARLHARSLATVGEKSVTAGLGNQADKKKIRFHSLTQMSAVEQVKAQMLQQKQKCTRAGGELEEKSRTRDRKDERSR